MAEKVLDRKDHISVTEPKVEKALYRKDHIPVIKPKAEKALDRKDHIPVVKPKSDFISLVMPRIKKGFTVSRVKIFIFLVIVEFGSVKKAKRGERYSKERIKFAGNEIDKKVQRNAELESECLMFELLEGAKTVDQLNYGQLVGQFLLLKDKISQIEAREKELMQERQPNSDNA
nr:hypothetical protein Iba_chr06dCG9810 [Ipomoea batatas]